ncbi:hypothetical protein Poly30_05750 [Planctomycetes bacterium Poly30]|uniref:Uncharacterized protein n=2 Tax=Saltatorellus ferox TaxID=2528018 RepID=A0A518ELW7_9BACT|nr:hypothetical protein Poly30_05750 [Planctomycetes bacterium Poly30]
MNVIAIVSAAGALTFLSMGVTRQVGLEGRLATMEEAAARSRTGGPEIGAMQARIDALTRQLEEQPSGLESAAATRELKAEMAALQTELEEAKTALRAQSAALDAVEALARKAERIDEVQAGVEVRWDGIAEALEAQAVLVEATRDELSGVRAQISGNGEVTVASSPAEVGRGSGDAWTDMVGPTVQLAGDATVGSGVILKSQPVDGTDGEYQTLLLTAWHVVRDIRADSVDEDMPIPVMLRDAFGAKRHATASLIAYDAPLDSALLVVNSTEAFPVGAALPTRARLKAARVFDPIVAVGCPLGNDPIPTRGHLSDLYHSVSSERFWMISAPTYIGNSGGGIYSDTSHELLGIFSKIYTHGAIRPTVIPHMGLVTPLEEFYDWIDGSQIAEVVESRGEATIVLR